jgi:hypothetical protein
MPVDASIPLQVQQPQFITPMQAQQQALTYQGLQQNAQLRNLEIQREMQTLKDQQELTHLGGDPSNLDKETGGFTAEALGKITNPLLRQTMTQKRMLALKEKADMDWKTSETAQIGEKRKSEALHSVMEEAYSAYLDTRKSSQGNEEAARAAFDKTLREGYEDIKATGKGGFPKDTQFKMLTPEEVGPKLVTHKERLQMEQQERTAARGEETPIIKETRFVEKLTQQLADTAPGTPQAQSLARQIAQVKQHIARLDRMPGAAGEEGKPPVGFRYQPGGQALEPIPGGPAARERRDTLQADALANYRARYPLGLAPEVYGKDQETPEAYTAKYIAERESKKTGAPAPKAAPTLPPRPKGKLDTISTKKAFDDLKPGTWYVDARDGKEKIKGEAKKEATKGGQPPGPTGASKEMVVN